MSSGMNGRGYDRETPVGHERASAADDSAPVPDRKARTIILIDRMIGIIGVLFCTAVAVITVMDLLSPLGII